MKDSGGKQSESQQTWKVPQIDGCRAMRVGQGDDIVFCLVSNAQTCGFSLRFGSGFMCLHPKRGEIVARTMAETHR